MVPVVLSILFFFIAVSLGKMPGEEALKGTPLFSKGEKAGATVTLEPTSGRVAQQANTLMSLINAHKSLSVASKGSRVWLGEGLGSILKRVHERMIHWEFMDMADFRPCSLMDPTTVETDTEKLVVLPGFEVLQPRKKPVNNFITWIQCFCRYTAAMSR